MQVQDIGEQGLLQRLQSFCPPDVIGDDAAILSLAPGRSLVVTTDVLVDEVHFSDRTTQPEDVGWRSVAANLSDLAAMGAAPLGITVGLSLPGGVPVSWVEQLYRGMVECLEAYGSAIVGGDICRSPVRTIAITALGQVAPDRAIQRSTAQPGDAILVTGAHGSSRAGLELLLHPELGRSLSPENRNALIQAHQRPKPRLDVLPLLQRVVEGVGERGSGGTEEELDRSLADVRSSFPVAGMDSSDGLADAVLQICRASSVGARVERFQISIAAALQDWITPAQALEWALYGGEDFELVLCLPFAIAQALLPLLGVGAAIVGTVTADPQVLLVDATGKHPDRPLTLNQGFQHF